MDRGKVIKGIHQHCEGSMFDRCGECPYYEIDHEPFVCRDMLLNDLNELLKDYEVLEKQHEISNELLKPNRRTGKWIEEKTNNYTTKTYCSVCKEPAPFIAVEGDYYGRNMHGKTEKTKYCPNCGAIMTH